MRDVVRIGVDAMGGDHGSTPVIEGAVGAAKRLAGKVRITLVGDEKEIADQILRLHAGQIPIGAGAGRGAVSSSRGRSSTLRRFRTNSRTGHG